MFTNGSLRAARLVLIPASFALLVSSCSLTVGSPAGPAPNQAPAGMMGGGMMGGASGYAFSPVECSAPSTPPGRQITVVFGDMGMTRMMGGDAPIGAPMLLQATPETVRTGDLTFVVQNRGWRIHELVILPLPEGQSAGQRVPDAEGQVDESGSFGEASRSCGEGSGDGIASGSLGWVTVNLSPGRYELVCNLKNHYANGMFQEIDVTA